MFYAKKVFATGEWKRINGTQVRIELQAYTHTALEKTLEMMRKGDYFTTEYAAYAAFHNKADMIARTSYD